MAEPAALDFPEGPYISLVTFRRDGREVATPVWFVAQEGRLWAYTDGKTGKVKRIRATGRVRVAPCTLRGKVTGAWREGTGRIVENGVADAETSRQVMEAIAKKYGWAYRLITVVARLTRKMRDRAVLELELEG